MQKSAEVQTEDPGLYSNLLTLPERVGEEAWGGGAQSPGAREPPPHGPSAGSKWNENGTTDLPCIVTDLASDPAFSRDEQGDK